jgi:hypothetical protein
MADRRNCRVILKAFNRVAVQPTNAEVAKFATNERASCPGLTRASTPFLRATEKNVDGLNQRGQSVVALTDHFCGPDSEISRSARNTLL